jgi:hypothetical protein
MLWRSSVSAYHILSHILYLKIFRFSQNFSNAEVVIFIFTFSMWLCIVRIVDITRPFYRTETSDQMLYCSILDFDFHALTENSKIESRTLCTIVGCIYLRKRKLIARTLNNQKTTALHVDRLNLLRHMIH